MHGANFLLPFFATGTLAALVSHSPLRAGLNKREFCQISLLPGLGACKIAAQKCGWTDSTVLCSQDEDGNFNCFDPGQGQVCCADGSTANPGESCNGATVASGTWLSTSSTAYAEPSSGDYYAPLSSSSPWDNSYSSYEPYSLPHYPTPEVSSQGYGPVGTGPPGWPSSTRTLYGGSPSSSVVGLSAGATTCPRLGLDAAGVALAAVGAFLI